MRRGRRNQAGTVVIAALAAMVCAVPTVTAAPVFTVIGHTALGNDSGGCTFCNAVQFATGSTPSYVFPYDGVLTTVLVRTGSSLQTDEWVQARAFRLLDATHAKVMAQGAQQTLTTASTTMQFWERIPVSAGEVLGALFHTNPFIDETPSLYAGGTAAGDRAGTDISNPGPSVGQDATATQYANRRVNIGARLEHDDDHDGYGDGSQDLCVADAAIATTACSGALFGSNLQGPYLNSGYSCGGPPCGRVQTSVGGVSTAAPADGVVVRWRLQAPRAGTYRVRVLEPDGSGSYVLARSSDPVTIGSDAALWTFTSQLPIKAGGYVAMAAPGTVAQTTLVSPSAGSTFRTIGDLAEGATTTLPGGLSGIVGYDADIEPDADHDGFGDVTQDQCPSNAATHGTCPDPTPGPGGTTTDPGGTTTEPGTGPVPGVEPAAQVTAFTLSSKRFRVKQAGAVVARRAHAGTTLIIVISGSARARIRIARLTKGTRSRGHCVRRTRANRHLPRCTRATAVHSFTRAVSAGTNALPYSGRYRARGRTRTLRPGRYRFSVAVLSADGRPGTARSRRATVAR
jgi:hypothetical protein